MLQDSGFAELVAKSSSTLALSVALLLTLHPDFARIVVPSWVEGMQTK
jgi:hypothetical protein